MFRTFGTKRGFGNPKKPLDQVVRNVFNAVKTPIKTLANYSGRIGSAVDKAAAADVPFLSDAAKFIQANPYYQGAKIGVKALDQGIDLAGELGRPVGSFINNARSKGRVDVDDVIKFGKEEFEAARQNGLKRRFDDIRGGIDTAQQLFSAKRQA